MSLLDRFRKAVASGALKADEGQKIAAENLHALSRKLAGYRPPGRFSLRRPPRGIYLWGDVGRGKSMLMDMFFEEVAMRAKRRIHFNEFMGQTHELLHEERRRGRTRDPIVPVAKQLARDAALLCFDEFQVDDVADAMILGRLFEQLWSRGSVIVVTSNIEPGRLYMGGLNRQLFLPFIAMIEKRMNVLGLNGDLDYRHGFEADGAAYFTPLGDDAEAAMDDAWRVLTEGAAARETALTVLGRKFKVPRAAKGVARFSFADLCVKALAAADYLAVAKNFHAVLIDHIPVMGAAQRDEARRFTLLIDTLYDENVRLVCSAEAPAPELYPAGDGAQAFKRTVSRLLEMQSAAYISKVKR